MKLLFIMWVGCLVMMTYYIACTGKSGIYPPKRVLRSKASKWGMAGGGLFLLWLAIILIF